MSLVNRKRTRSVDFAPSAHQSLSRDQPGYSFILHYFLPVFPYSFSFPLSSTNCVIKSLTFTSFPSLFARSLAKFPLIRTSFLAFLLGWQTSWLDKTHKMFVGAVRLALTSLEIPLGLLHQAKLESKPRVALHSWGRPDFGHVLPTGVFVVEWMFRNKTRIIPSRFLRPHP